MLRIAAVLSASVVLFSCRQTDGDVPIRARAADGGIDASAPPVCERLPTDLAVPKVPYPQSVSWSADGALIAAAMGQTGEVSSHVEGAEGIVVWSASDGVVRKRYRIQVGNVAFAPAGRRLAFSSFSESGFIDLRADCAVRWPRGGPRLAWRSDGRGFYVAGLDGISAIDSVRGPLREWPLPDRTLNVVSMDASSGIVAFGDPLHTVRIADADLRRVDVLADAGSAIGNARAVAIAPNGRAVASAVIERIPIKYSRNVMPDLPFDERFFVRVQSLPEGRESARFTGDAEALAFSPDSESLAVAGILDARLIVRHLASGAVQVLDEKVFYPQQIAWTRDGAALALADWRGAIRIYDPQTAARRACSIREECGTVDPCAPLTPCWP